MPTLGSIPRRSLKKALAFRKQLGIAVDESVNVYDVATSLGLEVRFVDIPSLEGMYSQGSPATIVISSLRPIVRQVFTCAHELGHHAFEHGEMVDELSERRSSAKVVDPREQEADGFGGNLLMTPTAVDAAFAQRKIDREHITPKEAFYVASYFQVGYTTLIRHLQLALRRLSWSQAENLVRRPVRELRSEILGQSCPNHLVLVDDFWNTRVPLDCEVGDFIYMPRSIEVDGSLLRPVRTSGQKFLLEALTPGQLSIELSPSASMQVRIARKQYTGRLIYRWEPEVNVV
jgi:Zn-dependent peptidase ImmA (M78 family)